MSPLKRGTVLKVKNPKSFRLSPLATKLLDMLANREGLDLTNYIEWSLRRDARAAGIDLAAAEKQAMEEHDVSTENQAD